MPASRMTTPDFLFGRRPGWIAVAVIGALLAGLGFEATLRAQSGVPASKAKVAPKAGDAEGAKPGQPLESVNLAHVPVEATSFMAYRPARTMRGGGSPVRGEAHESLLLSLDHTGQSFQLKADAASLEQVVQGLVRSRNVDVVVHRDPSEFLVVRSVAPIDWKDRVLRSMTGLSGEKPKWVDVPFEGRGYSRIDSSAGSAAKAPAKGPGDRLAELLQAPRLETERTHGPFFYFPDNRTLVVAASDDVIRGIIRQPAGAVPVLARTDGWKRISRDQIACAWAMDKHDLHPDPVAAMWMEFFAMVVPLRSNHPRQFFAGLGTDDKLRLAMDEDFDDPSETNKTAGARTRQLGTMGVSALVMGFQRDPGVRTFSRWFVELSLNGRFRPDGRRLAFESSCRMTLAELDGFFGGTPKPAAEAPLPFP